MPRLDYIPTLKQRFYINRQLILKSVDLIVVSFYIFFIQIKQRLQIAPTTGNWFVTDSARDLFLAYLTLAVAIFGIYISLNKHNMVRAKKYAYFAIALSWSSYLALFLYKALYLAGSWLIVWLMALVILSILMELLIGDWDGDGDN